MAERRRRTDICVWCGKEGEIAAHGFCYRCYRERQRAFQDRQAGDPGEKNRIRMQRADSAFQKALVTECGLTHQRADEIIRILSVQVKCLADYLNEQRVEPERLAEHKETEKHGIAGAPEAANDKANLSAGEGSGSRPEEGDMMPADVNVNTDGSSRSHSKPDAEGPKGTDDHEESLPQRKPGGVSFRDGQGSPSQPEPPEAGGTTLKGSLAKRADKLRRAWSKKNWKLKQKGLPEIPKPVQSWKEIARALEEEQSAKEGTPVAACGPNT